MAATFLAGAYIYLETVQSSFFKSLAWSSLVVIVHDVDLSSSRTTIAGSLCIIDDAVAEIYILCLDGVLPFIGSVVLIASVTSPSVTDTIEAGATVHQMTQKVVVEAGELSSPNTSVTMGTL